MSSHSTEYQVIGSDSATQTLYIVHGGVRYGVEGFAFQFQEGFRPKTIWVTAVRDAISLKLKFSQDLERILEDIYEEDCTYRFKILSVHKDPENGLQYLTMRDEYGITMKHRLYNPNNRGINARGLSIDCTVAEIRSSYLVLNNAKYQINDSVENDVVDENIKPEDLRLFKILQDKRQSQFASMNDHSMKGVWKSVIDKYPDSAHFIYELLQNADDADARKVTIYLAKDALYFKHNGKVGFTISDDNDESQELGHVNAIVAIGDSTKDGSDGQKVNKIGKFGVGFKAVFQYTNTPIIYSDYFKFRIENYIVPVLISEDSEYRDSGETLFEIPFTDAKVAYKEIREKLQSMKDPMLFLNNIHEIVWKDLTYADHEKRFTKILHSEKQNGSIKRSHYKTENPESTQDLWLFSRNVTIKNEGIFPISVGYYIATDDDGTQHVDTEIRPKIHCFFPTSETFDACFICHAPFLLVDNRQQIKRNEDINKFLQSQIIKLACDAILEFKEIDIENGTQLIGRRILDIVPTSKSSNSYYYDTDLFCRDALFDSFAQLIKSYPLFLSRDGKYIGINQTLLAQPVSLKPLLSPAQLRALINRDEDIDFLAEATSKDSEKWRYLEQYIGLNVWNASDLAEALNPSFMSEQHFDWVLNLYRFLSNDARELWNLQKGRAYDDKGLKFRYAPIVKTTNEIWVSPYKGGEINVFFSGGGGNEDYKIVHPDYYKNEVSRKFLTDLGLKEPDLQDFIKSHILSKYSSNTDEISLEENVADLEVIINYADKVAAGDYAEYIENVKNSFKVYTLNGELYSAEDTYFPTKFLKTFFQGENVDFVDTNAYRKIGKEKIESFLPKIGVNITPIIEKNYYHSRWSLTSRQRAELSIDDYKEHSDEYGVDWIVQGLKNALNNNLSKGLSIQIWQWLATEKFAEKLTLVFNFHYYQYIPKSITATWVNEIRQIPWIYVSERTRKAPENMTLEDFEKLSEIYPYSKQLYELLQLKRTEFSLAELGASEGQIKNHAYGEKVHEMAKQLGLSDSEVFEALKEKAQKKQAEEKKAKEKIAKDQEKKKDRQEMKDYSSSETFAGLNTDIDSSSKTKKDEAEKTTEEKVEEIKQKQQEALDQTVKEEELRNEVKTLVENGGKYSVEWFRKLLELEYSHEGDNVETFGRKSTTIQFSEVKRDPDSERIYILKNPSAIIPMEIEEIGGITVQFSFFKSIDDVSFGFEVASVRNFTLRLKAKQADSDKLKEIDWSLCSKATITINNSIALVKKLSDAFNELDLSTGFNLKESLSDRDNISFVFGPPGTGKTTYLAQKITELMNMGSDGRCKILVLTPTNKACDVLTVKTAEQSEESINWLGRFLTSEVEWLDREGYVHTKEDTKFLSQDKCCVVTTTARLTYDGFGTGYDAILLKEVDWDYVIIDEASMVPLAQVAYTLYKFPDSRIIIAGDPMQIAPIVKEEQWKGENIYTMTNLLQFSNPKTEPRQFEIVNLTTQYRSVPEIGRVFSEFAYQGQLTSHRESSSRRPLDIKGFEFMKPINFVTFKVDRYDNICAPKKLSSSNVHVYSVLLVVEMCKYMAVQYGKGKKKALLKIGVICPYAAQAQMINKLIEQSKDVPDNVEITVGTVHGFQGDECDVIFAVFNPPVGLGGAESRVLINNKNVVNVAISRAKDYLFILIPQKDYIHFDKMKKIVEVGQISTKDSNSNSIMTADRIEEIIFKEKGFIENNTFVTIHQMANVYTDPASLYEVRIDEGSVDIQLSGK